MSYSQLVQLILPVFAMVAIGVLLRRVHWIEGAAEGSLIRLVIYLCFPCLIFESVVTNATLQSAGNLLVPPLVGSALTIAGISLAWQVGRLLGFEKGNGLRTFALSAGLGNYSYVALPILVGMFGEQSRGVLFVHNIGVEATVWTVGVLVLSGLSLREGWKRLFSPMVVTLIAAVVLNLTGAGAHIPGMVHQLVNSLAGCAIPMGLILTGVNLANYLNQPRELVQPRVLIGAAVIRFGLIPLMFVAVARWLPCSAELKRVIVVQGAMPAAVIPILLAQFYGGRPIMAVQIVLGTTALGVLLTPLWLRVGMAWAGV